jgi:short-subunit dehydrogenase
MPKVIIIGASRGIGKELVRIFSLNHYEVGLMGRNTEAMLVLQKELPQTSFVRQCDVADINNTSRLSDLLNEMGDVDIIIINAGVLHSFAGWKKELETIQVNVVGFSAMAQVAIDYFKTRKNGHLVGISSIAAYKGGRRSPAYNASKAFVVNYLKGLRKRIREEKLNITITDVRPGYVATEMTKNRDGMFWVASPQKAAQMIYKGVLSGKKRVYVTRRWRIVAWMLRLFDV